MNADKRTTALLFTLLFSIILAICSALLVSIKSLNEVRSHLVEIERLVLSSSEIVCLPGDGLAACITAERFEEIKKEKEQEMKERSKQKRKQAPAKPSRHGWYFMPEEGVEYKT